jgi:predicted ATPase
MARQRNPKRRPIPSFREGPDFSASDLFIGVAGFKAIHDEIQVRVAPLTIISGANSGGKSSFMQPLLLMKQTLDAGFDPGPLLLHGLNAKFTERGQTLSKGKARGSRVDQFSVDLRVGNHHRRVVYADSLDGFKIDSDTFEDSGRSVTLHPGLNSGEARDLEDRISGIGETLFEQARKGTLFPGRDGRAASIGVRRERCFLEGGISVGGAMIGIDPFDSHTNDWARLISGLIHVPGLRGNPEREYPRAAVGQIFPGTFDQYVASVILEWGERGDSRLSQLSGQMEKLGLTWKVLARKKNDATVEVLVGRVPHAQQGGAQDLVSIADVGFGVSQTLPVVVSLLCAEPGQIVYIEQPEIHLHPRAQIVLGQILVAAASRGVKVVAETHSSLLIRSIQTEIALAHIEASAVSLNWFSRDSAGHARKAEAEVDTKGRFGDWPLDFDDVADDADVAYIEAIRAGVRS